MAGIHFPPTILSYLDSEPGAKIYRNRRSWRWQLLLVMPNVLECKYLDLCTNVHLIMSLYSLSLDAFYSVKKALYKLQKSGHELSVFWCCQYKIHPIVTSKISNLIWFLGNRQVDKADMSCMATFQNIVGSLHTLLYTQKVAPNCHWIIHNRQWQQSEFKLEIIQINKN